MRILICTLLCLGLHVARAQVYGLPSIGKHAADLDARFQNTNGWIGADGSYSVPLSKDTTLWLFSDTFVGEIRGGKRVKARMINNSVAIQNGTNAPAFFYGQDRQGLARGVYHAAKREGVFLAGPGHPGAGCALPLPEPERQCARRYPVRVQVPGFVAGAGEQSRMTRPPSGG